MDKENKENHIEILVGMTDDYNGRHFIAKDNPEPVLLTSFYRNEKKTFNTFMSYIEKLFPEGGFSTKHEGNYSVYSKNRATLFNEYYTYSKDNIGYLNQQKFDTDEKKINFISGTFLRYGTINENDEVEVTFSNSLSHFEAVQNFIEELGWNTIEVNNSEDSFPQVQKVIFVPHEENMKKLKDFNKR